MAAPGERAHSVPFDAPTEDSTHDLAEALGFSAQDDRVQPEQQLFRAVIHRAFADAFAGDDRGGPQLGAGDQREEGARGRAEANKANARRWLTSDIDAEDRKQICELAGVDPERVRALAQKKLSEAKAAENAEFEEAAEQAEETVAQTRRQESAFRRNLLGGSLLDIRSTRRGPYRPEKPTQRPDPIPGL